RWRRSLGPLSLPVLHPLLSASVFSVSPFLCNVSRIRLGTTECIELLAGRVLWPRDFSFSSATRRTTTPLLYYHVQVLLRCLSGSVASIWAVEWVLQCTEYVPLCLQFEHSAVTVGSSSASHLGAQISTEYR
ncbi:hypothetical protein C8F04DRAFT_1149118, partial [Mycena alexandri]